MSIAPLLSVDEDPSGLQVEELVLGSKRLHHGQLAGRKCTLLRFELTGMDEDEVLSLCRQDVAMGCVLEGKRAACFAPAKCTVYSQEFNSLFTVYQECKCTLKHWYASRQYEQLGLSRMEAANKVHSFFSQTLSSGDSVGILPRQFDHDNIMVTPEGDLLLADLSLAVPCGPYAGFSGDSVVTRCAPVGVVFTAPEMGSGEGESTQTSMFQASLSEANLLSDGAITLAAIEEAWTKDTDLAVQSMLPAELLMHAHVLQLALKKVPAERLRLEGRLGHTLTFFKDGAAVSSKIEAIEKRLHSSPGLLKALSAGLEPQLARTTIEAMMGEKVVECMRFMDPAKRFGRSPTRLCTSTFSKAEDCVTGLRYVSSHLDQKADYLGDVLKEHRLSGDKDTDALWRYFFASQERTKLFLHINTAALASGQEGGRASFWNVPDHRAAHQEAYGGNKSKAVHNLTIVKLLKVVAKTPSSEAPNRQSSHCDGKAPQAGSSAGADPKTYSPKSEKAAATDHKLAATKLAAEKLEAQVAALQGIEGRCLLVDCPSLLGQPLELSCRFARSDPGLMRLAYYGLSKPTLPKLYVEDRLRACLHNVILCHLRSGDALMIACEAASAELAKGAHGSGVKYEQAALGVAYVCAVQPTCQLSIEELGVSVAAAEFIKAHVMMHYVHKEKYDAALSVATQGSTKLEDVRNIALRLKQRDYWGALKAASQSTNPVVHLHLGYIDVGDWMFRAAASSPPMIDGESCSSLRMIEAAEVFGFWLPAVTQRTLDTFPECCKYKVQVNRKVLGAEATESAATEQLRLFLERRVSKFAAIKAAKVDDGNSEKVVLFKSAATTAATAAAAVAGAVAGAGTTPTKPGSKRLAPL